MTLVITTISPKRKTRRTRTITIEIPEGVGRHFFTIRINGRIPRRKPHNISDATWSAMREVHRKLNVRHGHIIQVDSIR